MADIPEISKSDKRKNITIRYRVRTFGSRNFRQKLTRRMYRTIKSKMEYYDEENRMVQMLCVSCVDKTISVDRKHTIAFEDVDLMCKDCRLSYELSRDILFKGFFGSSMVYCPWACGIRCKPQEIGDHEIDCNKKTIRFVCLLENCTKILPIRDLIQHVHDKHADNLSILDVNNKYKVPLSTSMNRQMLLLHDKDYIGNEVYWQFIFKNGQETHLMIQHVCSFKGQYHVKKASLTRFLAHKPDAMSISGNVVLKNQRPISFDITPIKQAKVMLTMIDSSVLNLPQKLSPEFYCDVCADFLTLPVRLCNNGHSLCEECFMKLTKCPKCKMDLSQARNYALERIVQHVNTKCKYHTAGCKERPTVDTLRQHMDRCYFRPFKCPVCNIAICYKDIAEHNLTNCIMFRELGVPYSNIAENGCSRGRASFAFSAYDEIFFLHIRTANGKELDVPGPPSAISSASSQKPLSTDSSIPKNVTGFDLCVMKLFAENYTAINDVDYYFDITVSEPIEKKSITFSAQCDLKNVVDVPKDYFTAGRSLQVTLEIYSRIQFLKAPDESSGQKSS